MRTDADRRDSHSAKLTLELGKLNNSIARLRGKLERSRQGSARATELGAKMRRSLAEREKVLEAIAKLGRERATETRRARAPSRPLETRPTREAGPRAKRGEPTQARNRPQLVESKTVRTKEGALTFELRLIQCGKARCKKWHGPYWYAEHHRGSRVAWVYVGRELDVEKARERMRAKLAG